jgi:hypothetical protein
VEVDGDPESAAGWLVGAMGWWWYVLFNLNNILFAISSNAVHY